LPNSRALKIASWLVVFLLLFQPVKQAFDVARNPFMGQDIVPAIEYVHQNWSEGDVMYVYYGAYPAFSFYLPQFSFPEENIIRGTHENGDWMAHLSNMDVLSNENERVWFLFSHVYEGNGLNDEVLMIHYLQKIGGQRIAEFQAAGATAYLYEFLK
jgi:hypothetical protein